MKNMLFPTWCRILGWVLFIPSVILGVMCETDVMTLSGAIETAVNDTVIIGIVVGALIIVCSKEPHEVEMTRSIRLASLLNSLYIYVILLVAATLLVNGMAYFRFMMVNLVLLPMIFVVIFRLEMRRYNQMGQDEEQNQN